MIVIPHELMGEYTVRVMDLPVATPGFVICDETDHMNIYLNSRYSYDAQKEAAGHELTHIINDDFHNSDDIRTVEARAGSVGACPGAPMPLSSIPTLKKARDLIPQPPAAPKRKIDLSPRQAAVIFSAISDLDRFIFSDRPFYEE